MRPEDPPDATNSRFASGRDRDYRPSTAFARSTASWQNTLQTAAEHALREPAHDKESN